MTDKYSLFNPTTVLTANNIRIAEVKMKIFNDDGTPVPYEDMPISDMTQYMTAMLAVVSHLEMRHILILLDNMNNMTERAALSAGDLVKSMINTPQAIGIVDTDLLNASLNSYFNDFSEPNTDIEVADRLKDFFPSNKKLH